jgi:hypothetical protein
LRGYTPIPKASQPLEDPDDQLGSDDGFADDESPNPWGSEALSQKNLQNKKRATKINRRHRRSDSTPLVDDSIHRDRVELRPNPHRGPFRPMTAPGLSQLIYPEVETLSEDLAYGYAGQERGLELGQGNRPQSWLSTLSGVPLRLRRSVIRPSVTPLTEDNLRLVPSRQVNEETKTYSTVAQNPSESRLWSE